MKMSVVFLCRSRFFAVGCGGGGGLFAKCEVMGFCLKLANLKKRGGGFYPFYAQLKFSKTRRGGVPWMCTSVYLSIFWAWRRKIWGCLGSKVMRDAVA